MKDSRLGTYGVAGLVLMLSAKFLLLKELVTWFSFKVATEKELNLLVAATMVAAHAIRRLMPVFVIQYYQYVTAYDGSKSKPLASKKLQLQELTSAVFFALLPFAFFHYYVLLALVPVFVISFKLASHFKKWIGGYTGDCLGAIQQVAEITFYLYLLIIWKYIL